MGKIILASSSPRRANILKNLNLDFEIIPSMYAEVHDRTVFSYDFVEMLAYNKALAVAKKYRNEERKVIGADTIVVIDNKILGKPKNKEDAVNMLKMLSGRTHFVVTGVAVINSRTLGCKIKSVTTYVSFEKLTDEQIEFYIENYKPYDKAGSYGIQELPAGYIKEFRGSFDNVIGLPSAELLEMINEN